MKFRLVFALALSFVALSLMALAGDISETPVAKAWDPAKAARYLDQREVWWQSWQPAQRDHGTSCISCHTVVPYALARPLLRKSLQESVSASEKIMFERLEKRVQLWDEVEPFYKDASAGPGKSVESRATESVLNALILSSYDAQQGQPRWVTRKALDAAWKLQLTNGPMMGAWNWQVFHLAPWESDESQYHGAALFALAVGMAPFNYKEDLRIQNNVGLLRGYLKRNRSAQPLLNQVVLLWASSKLPGLLDGEEASELVKLLVAKQQQDGGWVLADLGSWKRKDGSALDSTSDGYATGLVTLALEESGLSLAQPAAERGLAWLSFNQDPAGGFWYASSLNKKRNPSSDIGRFMSDAATGYAVLALENRRQ